MVEAVVLWNEPNNLSHWNFHLDPGWCRYADMVKLGSEAIRRVNRNLPIVLGGVSSCDCDFLRNMAALGVMDYVDAVGVHGFPLDWIMQVRPSRSIPKNACGVRAAIIASSATCKLPSVPFLYPTGIESPLAICRCVGRVLEAAKDYRPIDFPRE